MKASELLELSVEELRQKAQDLESQLFRMRIQKATGQLETPLKLRTMRRDLARVNTVIRQKA